MSLNEPSKNTAISLLDKNAPPPRAVIFGVAAKELSQAERDFFAAANPLGFIIFARNCDNPAQLRKLTDDLRQAVGRNAPILVDQEGGRVARMKPPHWTAFPAASHYGALWAQDEKNAEKITEKDISKLSKELRHAGINANCAPVLDIRYPETHDAIGDRAYSQDVAIVNKIGTFISTLYLQNNIVPIVKHIPGQGRATLDSHKALPRVATGLPTMEKTDFAPYHHLLKHRFASAVWGMVSHILYEAVDAHHPASCSPKVINELIRKKLGFDGLLLSDDLSMDALAAYGDEAGRAVHVIKAGCDIALHCNGKLDEMKRVAAKMPPMTAIAVERYNRTVRWMMQNRPAV